MVWYLEFKEEERPEGGSLVVCGTCGPLKCENKEPAGHLFHLFCLKQAGLWEDPEEKDCGTPTSSKSGQFSRQSSVLTDNENPTDVQFKTGGKKKQKVKKKKDADLYKLLGLENERWTATEKQMKDAYRRVCLEYHPDKKLAGVTDEVEKSRIEEYFKQIQDAYATLSDPAKRREYDSVDEFDDSLPSECAAQDFFKVFGPAFRRNARWSLSPKVPEVGDDDTEWAEVEKFYNFWFTFKSWREFPHPDEEDVEGCEGREHRRYVERINSKLREKGKKEEGKRLKQFVEDAYRIDPRVVAKKEEERLEKERKKQEKEEARMRAEQEAQRIKDEEEAALKAKEDEEKGKRAEEKAARELAKKATKKERQKLRMICDDDGSGRLVSEDDVDRLTAKLGLEGLTDLNNSISVFGMPREAQRELVIAAVYSLDGFDAEQARAKEQQKREAEKAAKEAAAKEREEKLAKMREWDDEELRLLDKALKKFPQGTPKRWDQVTAYIRTRTLDDVLLMVKEKQGMSATRVNKAEDFKAGQKKRAEVTCQADLRQHAFTDVEVNLSGTAAKVVENLVPPEELNNAVGDAPAAAPVAAPDANGTAAPQPAAAPAAAAAAAPDKKKTAASVGSGEWNEEQELALVKAMKQFGKELSDRWDRVSEVVPGKTKAQCFKRFKELREVFRAKKEGDA